MVTLKEYKAYLKVKKFIDGHDKVHVQNFGEVASRVPSLQATLPPSPQIFLVISDTSCHTPYLFFKNTNCVTPPQIIFADLQRFPSKLQFPKNFDL